MKLKEKNWFKQTNFFITNIAANHDGNLNKAIRFNPYVSGCGADAAKFQHFKAETIVSDIGFKKLKEKISSSFVEKECL